MILCLLFLILGVMSFAEFFISHPHGGLWTSPPASGKLQHICVKQPQSYRQRETGSLQISDVIPYMRVISCSWRLGPHVSYISRGYFWVTEKQCWLDDPGDPVLGLLGAI